MAEVVVGILEKDFENLKKKIDSVAGKVDRVHIDIIDGKFASNLTVGLSDIRRLKSTLNFTLHLMVEGINDVLESWCQSQASGLIFYPNKAKDTAEAIKLARSYGKRIGLALDTSDQALTIDNYLDDVDFVLVMTVPSGFSGEPFQKENLSKIGQLKSLKQDLVVGVDGGIEVGTARQAVESGADFVVANTSIFSALNPAEALEKLKADTA